VIQTSLRFGAFVLLSVSLAGCGKAPIEEAIEKNDRAAVTEAVKSGADVNETVGGETPLMLAAKTGQSGSAQALIEAGADIKVRDASGNGVLHYAAQTGMTGICGLLIDRGIAVDDKGAGGATALHLAILGARPETAKYLVRRGASLELKNDASQTALDLAVRAGDTMLKNDLELAAKIRGN
jgi:ankyrin repeat protein